MTEEIINSDGSRNWQANILLDNIKRLEQENNSLQAQLNNIIVQSNNAITALEQENFALTQESQQKSRTICELEQENKELKKDVQLFKCLDTFGESECHCACRCLGNEFCEDADKKINSYRSALEEISGLASPHCTQCSQIINIINEVLS